MRIVQVLGGLVVGGTETFVISLVRGLIDRGHDASLLLTTTGSSIGEAAASADIPFVHLDGGPPRPSARWFRAVGRYFHQNQFDIVHSYGLRASLGIRLIQRRVGIEHHLTGVRGLDIRRTGLQVWFDRRTEHRLDAIVCNAQAVATRRMSTVGTPTNRICVIPNGIDTDQFHPGTATSRATSSPSQLADPGNPSRESLNLPDGFLFVSVGNFRPEKDHPTLLEAIRGGGDDLAHAKFVLVGEGNLRKSIEARANELDIADRLVFTGAVKDVRPYLSACDAFVLTSHSEGSPRALLEAMAMGMPVVSTTAGGVVEIAEHERNALLVPTRSPEPLATAMLRVMRDEGLRKRIGAAAAKRIREHFSRKTMLDRHVELYESVSRGVG